MTNPYPLVVTYQHAYLPGRRVSLCRSHRRFRDDRYGALGPVAYGEHRGPCDSCDHAIESHEATPRQAKTIIGCSCKWG